MPLLLSRLLPKKGTLFGRIFVGFMVSVAVASLLHVVLTALMSRWGLLDISLHGRLRQSLLREAPGLIGIYEDRGGEALRTALDELRENRKIMAVVLDDLGGPLDAVRGRKHHLPERRTPPWMSSLPAVTEAIRSHSDKNYIVTFFALPGSLPPRDRFYLSLGCYLLAFLVVGGAVSYFLARQISRPLEALSRASISLASGDLSVRSRNIAVFSDDEIGQLASNFDSMADHVDRTITGQKRLLGDISHELRSPLTRLNLSVELLRGKVSPELGPLLERIERESERMNGMIGDLLGLARQEGTFHGTMERCYLKDLLETVLRDGRFEARSQGKDVVLISTADVQVSGDQAGLASALENVVRNGIKHTAVGSSVEIEVSQEDSEVVIAVRDRGPGVAEGNLEAIFRPFFREDSSRDRESGGVGLGLTITKRAVEAAGGSVVAANRPEGGLTVEIRLKKANFVSYGDSSSR